MNVHQVIYHLMKKKMEYQNQKKKKKKKKKIIKVKVKQSEVDKKLDPKYREKIKKQKELLNLSRTGFKIIATHRYRMDDGRIGICKYRGRTVFGKPNQDWIGILVEYGDGVHDGTVKGKKYFRCAPNRGIMVRPQRIIEDLGIPDGSGITKKMLKGSKHIKELMKDIAFEREEEYQKKKTARKKKKKHQQDITIYDEWMPPVFSDYEEDHGDVFKPKLQYNKKLFKNDIKAEKKPKMHEI